MLSRNPVPSNYRWRKVNEVIDAIGYDDPTAALLVCLDHLSTTLELWDRQQTRGDLGMYIGASTTRLLETLMAYDFMHAQIMGEHLSDALVVPLSKNIELLAHSEKYSKPELFYLSSIFDQLEDLADKAPEYGPETSQLLAVFKMATRALDGELERLKNDNDEPDYRSNPDEAEMRFKAWVEQRLAERKPISYRFAARLVVAYAESRGIKTKKAADHLVAWGIRRLLIGAPWFTDFPSKGTIHHAVMMDLWRRRDFNSE